jgi:hypothetical protein
MLSARFGKPLQDSPGSAQQHLGPLEFDTHWQARPSHFGMAPNYLFAKSNTKVKELSCRAV